MGKNYKRIKKERKQMQVQKQTYERALNFFVCDELRKAGSGNILNVRERILAEIKAGKRTIPDKYFSNGRK